MGVDEVEFPAAFVFGSVVVFTEGVEVVVVGWSAVYPALAVVEVGVDGGGATTGEDTVGVAGFDSSSLASGGSSAGAAVGDDLVVVDDMPAPFGVLLFGYLAGDVGEDWSPPGDLPGCVVQSEESLQIDADVDDGPFASLLMVETAEQEVETNVGAELIQTAGLIFGA